MLPNHADQGGMAATLSQRPAAEFLSSWGVPGSVGIHTHTHTHTPKHTGTAEQSKKSGERKILRSRGAALTSFGLLIEIAMCSSEQSKRCDTGLFCALTLSLSRFH